ncbi:MULTISPECIES: hypothetical protein [unclassified Bacillus (in: firmicutes)]|uniref:hypothetical protein n=1 Tax=unclassified Bacillus (in: firmicutes) TaxID=185979 RepID=UPI0008ECF9FD|nr:MULTISPECIES: hypothetical protein [unclassified Bacillus (in: firmicutes)]SFB04483.1 hypothetical protein SAMN02799634_104302 [Bacillus sp. UNCCL13]
MFFLLLTAMIISFVVGTTLLIKAQWLFGSLAIGLGVLLLLFILFYYRKKKRKKLDCDCIPDIPDCDFDCDGKPDCDCTPDCN